MTKMAYSDLNLRELRVLHILIQQCSITRAAKLMETTQPSISKTLARLRKQSADPGDSEVKAAPAKAIDLLPAAA